MEDKLYFFRQDSIIAGEKFAADGYIHQLLPVAS